MAERPPRINDTVERTDPMKYMDLTSVRVELPIGESTFALATADCFEPDVLTVSSTDPTREPELDTVFQPDKWICATVYSTGGFPLFYLRNETWRRARTSSRTPRTASDQT
jgi:hypothetical protein